MTDWKQVERALRKDRAFMEKKQAEKRSAMPDKILYYAGIGSRNTPEYILTLMTSLAEKLRDDLMVLRTGHATGADQAFEYGAGGAAHIYLPWAAFNQDNAFISSRDEKGDIYEPTIFNEPTLEARAIARLYHPYWEGLTPGAQNLHARNSHQILGPKPQSRPTPVEFVLCWTPDGLASGGTGQALRIASDHGVPIHNLHDEDTYDMAFLWAYGEDGDPSS